MRTAMWRSLVLGALVSVLPAAWSQGIHWSFNATNYVVLPTDDIMLAATVFNDTDAIYNIAGGGSVFAGDLQKTYAAIVGDDLFDQNVPAHGTLPFLFRTLTPIGGLAPMGSYVADPAAINFAGTDTGLVFSDNSFQIVVVPEPGVASIAAGAALLWVAVRMRRSGRRAYGSRNK